MIESNFLITRIDNIIYVDDTKLKIRHSDYTCCLASNELYFNNGGTGTTYFNDSVLTAEKGCVTFLPKGECERYEVFRDGFGTCIDIFFQTDRPLSPIPLQFDPVGRAKIQGLFQKAFTVWMRKKDGYYHKCLSILYEIFSELHKTSYIPEKKYQIIKPAVDYIERHFKDSDFSYTTLPKICGISYSYFKRLFIEKFGVPPQKYVTQLRINYACDLLSSNLYNITQIAELVGIPDIYYFSKVFKGQTGIAPSLYTKEKCIKSTCIHD